VSHDPASCPLCRDDGGLVVLHHERFRVVRVQGAEAQDFPAFYRVVWHSHVAEWSDLDANDQALCMRGVTAVERVLRAQLQPTKINLAALGNMVPHLHWHVVARFDWDSRFPSPVWAPPVRDNDGKRLAWVHERLGGCDHAIAQAAL
jgi:diadenosine tetraphosphate (Ap4A) HIT family hydrolase